MGCSKSWQFTLLVVILLILRASTETSPSVKKSLIVIPGLGRIDRLETVVHNLKLLKSQRDNRAGGMVWDCIVYIYAAREVTSFWSESEHLKFLYSECQIVEVANKRVTENLYMVQPAFVSQLYENVVLFLDDCKIEDSRSFDLARILRIMKLNNLTVASPMVCVYLIEVIDYIENYILILSLSLTVCILYIILYCTIYRLSVQTKVVDRNSVILCKHPHYLIRKAISLTS